MAFDAETMALALLAAKKGGGGGGSSTLSGLDDVSISSPQGGEVLKYDTSTEKWENASSTEGKILTGTLTAGQTSIQFTDTSITANALISIYTSADEWYISRSVSGTTLTITFDEQASDMAVTVEVK